MIWCRSGSTEDADVSGRSEGAQGIYRLFNSDKRLDVTGFRDYTKVIGLSFARYDSTNDVWINEIGDTANKLKGIVVKSGDTFSFNDTIGEYINNKKLF